MLLLFTLISLFLCSADIAVLKEQVAMLQFRDRISTDPRLALFSPAIKSRNGKHSVASDYHRSSFSKCVFCESENNVTMAHLISEVVPDDSVSLASFALQTIMTHWT